MIGLPLQRSVFDQLYTAGDLIGLADVLESGRFEAELDESGSLLVARASVDALRAAFPARPDQAFLQRLEERRRTVCKALIAHIGHAREAATGSDHEAMREAACDLLQRVADFIPYAILTKIVPELLWQAISIEKENRTPSSDGPSAGLHLTLSLERLARFLWASGAAPDVVAASWPDVPVPIAAAVNDFCVTHAGFGPVAWEGLGYDSAEYVLSTLRGLEDESGGPGGEEVPEYPDLTPDLDARPMTPTGALYGWLELTDLQIWYLRTAFYHGLKPLFVRLGESRFLPPQSFLFVSRHELATDDIPRKKELLRRIELYGADTDYLQRTGVIDGRLRSMFAGPL